MAELLVAEVQEGEFIGSYQVLSVLGRGPHATTYHVISNILGKEFALRTISLNEETPPEWIERLEAQAVLTKKLSACHIEATTSFGRFRDLWICVKDLVCDSEQQPRNLRSYMDQHGGRLSSYQCFHVLRQVLMGLQCAHGYRDLYHGGVPHGALKPENILLSASSLSLPGSPPFEVRLSDFQPFSLFTGDVMRSLFESWLNNVTKQPPLLADKAELAAAAAIRRAWDYLAPERLAGNGPTPQSDLFSVGVLAWEMLTGVPPGACPPKLTAFRSDLMQEWNSLVEGLLQSNPKLRIYSVDDALEQLEKMVPVDSTPTEEQEEHLPGRGGERLSLTPAGMVYIPRGTFLVGTEACGSDALPQHEVSSEGFYLDRTPVTNARFSQFVSATGYVTMAEENGGAPILIDGEWRVMEGISWKNPTGQPLPDDFSSHPVTQVTYDDALAYCTWANRRLPTELEWEYAARGGQRDCRYPWGDHDSVVHANANGHSTTPVMRYSGNGYGLYDMAGNVWEWTESYYQAYPGNHLHNPHFGERYRVVRGGCWLHDLSHCMVSYRNANQPDRCYPTVGFRTACDAGTAGQ